MLNMSQLEAKTQLLLLEQLGSDVYRLTPEFCKADGGYGPDKSLVLPIQVKSATQNSRRAWQFGHTADYHNMLVICRPVGLQGYLCIPGNELCVKAVYYRPQGIYQKYFVPYDRIKECLHSAWLQSTQGSSQFPAVAFESLCAPVSVQQRLSQEVSDARDNRLGHLFVFEPPQRQGSTVDVLINGHRVQDKRAIKRHGRQGHLVTVRKSYGRFGKRRVRKGPYNKDDFDFLWVHVPDEHFFVFPMEVLVKRGIVVADGVSGRTSFAVHQSDHWTAAHKYSYTNCTHLITVFAYSSWATVGDVADWQSAQLASALQADPSAPYTLENAPHRILVASEQGWQGSQNGPEERAKLLCKAWGHGNAVPNLAWITFMSFQEIGSDDFGLVPSDATLSNAQASPIYQAFLSTAPDTWDKNSDHYCCLAERLGCAI